jgi:hypothetical protein
MKGALLNYFFLMKTIKELPTTMTDKFPKDKSAYFNFANFLNVSTYSFIYNPFKKDKYKLQELIRNNYKEFIVEVSILFKAHMEDSDSIFIDGILFLYGLISTNTLMDYLYPYIKGIKKDSYNLDKALNYLDSYIAAKDNIDLTKTSLYELFPNAYTYYDSIEEFIRNPLIKCFRFMGSNSYYKKSYKRFHTAGKNSNKRGRLWDYIFFDKLFHKKDKKEYLIYTKYEDLSLLNLKKEDYIVNGITYNTTFEEVLDKALELSLKRIHALNSYLFLEKKDQEFRLEFNIDKNKKL